MTRFRVVPIAAALAAMCCTASPALAQGVEGTKAVSLYIGTGVGLGGNVILEGQGTILGQPAVFVEQTFSNHFSDALRIRGMFSWGLDYNKEVFGSLAYGKLNATERTVGSVAGYPLRTRFSNADAIDLEGGLRYYFLPEGPTRTYVNGVVGLRFLQEISATYRVVERGITLDGRPYFGSSTLFMFGGDAGVSRDIAEHIAIGAEVGLRYQPKPTQEEITIGAGFEDINDTGSRWSLPLSAFVTYRW